MRNAVIAACLMLAGCTSLEAPETLDDDTFTLHVADASPVAAAGQPWNFTLTVQGTYEATSDHIGGHYWDFATQDPSGDFDQAAGCQHVAGGGALPGIFHITCVFADPGTYYLHGHVRITDDETWNYWSDQVVVEVA